MHNIPFVFAQKPTKVGLLCAVAATALYALAVPSKQAAFSKNMFVTCVQEAQHMHGATVCTDFNRYLAPVLIQLSLIHSVLFTFTKNFS